MANRFVRLGPPLLFRAVALPALRRGKHKNWPASGPARQLPRLYLGSPFALSSSHILLPVAQLPYFRTRSALLLSLCDPLDLGGTKAIQPMSPTLNPCRGPPCCRCPALTTLDPPRPRTLRWLLAAQPRFRSPRCVRRFVAPTPIQTTLPFVQRHFDAFKLLSALITPFLCCPLLHPLHASSRGARPRPPPHPRRRQSHTRKDARRPRPAAQSRAARSARLGSPCQRLPLLLHAFFMRLLYRLSVGAFPR